MPHPNFMATFHMQTFCPDTLLPFETYRTPRTDGRGFQRSGIESCPSVAHFVFSERFRGYDDGQRQEILGHYSASEARKIVSRTEAYPNWFERHDQIIRSGLWKQFQMMPTLPVAILKNEVSLKDAHCLGKGWEKRNEGHGRWAQLVRSTALRFTTAEHRMSLLATGDTDINNPFLFTSRLDVLLTNRQPDQMIIACRQGVDSLAELWCIERYLPVVHFPLRSAPSAPVKTELLQALVELATHAILFSKEDSATVKAIIERLKALQVPTRHIRLDPNGRPLPKATTPTRATRPTR